MLNDNNPAGGAGLLLLLLSCLTHDLKYDVSIQHLAIKKKESKILWKLWIDSESKVEMTFFDFVTQLYSRVTAYWRYWRYQYIYKKVSTSKNKGHLYSSDIHITLQRGIASITKHINEFELINSIREAKTDVLSFNKFSFLLWGLNMAKAALPKHLLEQKLAVSWL